MFKGLGVADESPLPLRRPSGDMALFSRTMYTIRREHIPDVGASRRGEESIFLMWEPVAGGKRAYS
eukprot:1180675-Prorocentrum_minimum.AAC.2